MAAMIASAGLDAALIAGLVAALIYTVGVTLYSLHARLRDVERELEERRGA